MQVQTGPLLGEGSTHGKMAQPAGRVGRGLRAEAAAALFQPSSRSHTARFLPVRRGCLSGCSPSTAAQRERLRASESAVGPGVSSSLCLAWTDGMPSGFCIQKLWGLLSLALEPRAGASPSSGGTSAVELSLLILYCRTCVRGQPCLMSLPLLPVSLWLLRYVLSYRTCIQGDVRWFFRLIVL